MNCPVCNVACEVNTGTNMQRVWSCKTHGTMREGNVYKDAYMSVVYPDLELVTGADGLDCYLPKNRVKGDVKAKLDKRKLTYINCGCNHGQAKFIASLQDLRFVILECALCHVRIRVRRESPNTSTVLDADGKVIGRLTFKPENEDESR